MALKDEKAQSMFNKWAAMKRSLYVRDPDEPPPLIEECNSLKECYRWRETIMKEIGDKVAEIQNAGLGDYRIRALNDEINKLLNHKRMWEGRIRQLGGPDFTKNETRFFDAEGVELPGSGGYKYFGAAKDLPGVRELFFREAPLAPEKNLAELLKGLDDDYFGREPLPEELRRQVEVYEEQFRARAIEEWLVRNYERVLRKHPRVAEMSSAEIMAILREDDFDTGEEQAGLAIEAEADRAVLEKKKKELLRAYVGEIEDEPAEPNVERNPFVFTEEY